MVDVMKAVDLSSFENSWYQPGSAVKRLLWYVCNRVFLKTYFPYPASWKKAVLLLFGAKIGAGVVFKPDVNIKYPWFLSIGSNVWLGEGVWIDNLAQVTIGDNVCLSQGAFLLTGNHDYKRSSFDLLVKPILIESGVWVGAKAIVCPGVKLSSHAVVTVGSIIAKDAEAFTIYGGNPAVAIRSRQIVA